MKKYIVYIILVYTTNLFSQSMNEPLIKIKQIPAEESYHLISTHNFGVVAVDSAKKIIDFCSHHLGKYYQLQGHENIYLNVQYVDRSLKEIDLQKGCQVILNHIIDSLGLSVIEGGYQKGLKIMTSNVSVLSPSIKNSKDTAIVKFNNDFAFLQLYYLFDVLVIQPDWKFESTTKAGMTIPMNVVKDYIGDVTEVQRLLRKYGLITEVIDVAILSLE